MTTEKPHPSRAKIKESVDKATLRVTIASTLVAVLAAAAALWSGYEAHKARVDDERPFLAVDVKPKPPEEFIPAAPTLHTEIVAYGKSPARKLQINCVTFLHNSSEDVPWHTPNNFVKLTFPFLLPARSIAIGCPLRKDDRKDLYPNFIEMGIVQYEDDQQTHYTTPFCFNFIVTNNGPEQIRECLDSRGLPDLR